jgi:pimeloyl-ACP methyl ester carboxylesterase
MASPVSAASGVVEEGSLQGAHYRIEIPAVWNGVLLLYSHGYTVPGRSPRQIDAPSPTLASWLLAHGYALAGSAYSRQGWAVQQALADQVRLIDLVAHRHHGLRSTVLWGSSMGGLITVTLAEREPRGFAGALSMCGGVAGGVAEWNQRLDAAFALRTLLLSKPEPAVTGISDPSGNLVLARRRIVEAQGSPAGRARIALAAAIGELPGWGLPWGPQASSADEIEQAQFAALRGDASFFFARRAELEQRSGGNPSWNTGVDYRDLFLHSRTAPEVRDLYARAGLSLDQDLNRLARAPRIAASPAAVSYLTTYASPTGGLRVPVLTIHDLGDGLVPATEEQSYASAVERSGHAGLLRQLFVARAGHCTWTPAEQLVALDMLLTRIHRGSWPSWTPAQLNDRARATGLGLAAFTAKRPGTWLRPYIPQP